MLRHNPTMGGLGGHGAEDGLIRRHNMRKPYRLMVWGPGRMGKLCIWEITQSKAFELVGVRTYSDAKNGLDAGTLIGVEPLGIPVSNDVASLLKIDCDCIVYTARDDGTFPRDEEILMLLAAGKNIVTPLPYQEVRQCRDAGFVARLDEACRNGRSVFHAGGIDPDLMSDRILLGLTGACADVKSVRLQECWDCSFAAEGPLRYAGFAMSPADAAQVEVTKAIANNFNIAIVRTAERVLGVKYDRVADSHDYVPTSVDIETPFRIPAGTVGRIAHRMQGWVDAIGPHPFFTIEVNWLVGNGMLPEGVAPGQYYVGTIEGRPSIRMALDLKVSHQNNDRVFKLGNMQVEPSYLATLVPCLQAIPHVCAAQPGVLPSFGPSLHWMADLRDSVEAH
jgi:2,4-diaminopentanoate dehydrogenase